ncbi:type II and III secretion system protein family protein [Asticcacaulis sp. YBE204]|uniref:type II and III secretion system protein family protein n=1 Tax=Asticcacaulis sp. YBE204 TaxID=1282363 RepID=UPI0003C3BB5D|nr:type II and III secretion system protein family protein [Asticcacaulis sp. YBE204]ESQ78626.1 hypothetical protein AEYBE204_13830 [Asticcacaulis sp. YBE204]
MSQSKIRAVSGLLIAGAMLVGSAGAEPVPYKAGASGASAQMSVQTQNSPVRTQVLNLPKGRSAVIDLPVDAADVFVSNPAAADAVLRTPRRIFVLGVAAGQSDAIFFDGTGRQILNLSIRVDAPTEQLTDTIHRLYPQSKVEAQSVNGFIILSGVVANAAEAEAISRLAGAFAGKPENVVNTLAIAGKDQVTLKVRIIEVERSTIKQLGLSADITSVNESGKITYGAGRANTWGTNGSFQGGKGLCFGENSARQSATACLQAFERVGLVRTLAEPNLTAVSGEAAKFLAGGEFPVPVAQDNQGRVTVEFKPFGVGLGFTPVVLSGGRISLRLSTEVSELTNTGAYTNSTGLTLPALTVRRAESTVEMQSGSSLMIAGLLKSDYRQTIDSLPGVTNLPVLGSLFRSRDFQNEESELVIIVTPYIVSANDPDAFQTPADNLLIASDPEAVFLGRLNRSYKQKRGDTAPDQVAAGPYQAPIGYVIE